MKSLTLKLKLFAYISISRPLNVLISVLSVWTAVYISTSNNSYFIYLLTGIVAASLIAAANTINDIHDLEIDKINKPKRPLPKGDISKIEAIYFSVLLFISAIVPNFFLPVISLSIIITVVFLILAYTPYLKSIPLIGNIVVSGISACAFIYGASVVNNIMIGLFPFLIAFFIHLLREIIKDKEDEDGDMKQGVKTMAFYINNQLFKVIVNILILITMLLVVCPFIFNFFDKNYLLIILILVEPMLLFMAIDIIKRKKITKKNLIKYSMVLKVIMIIGLMAFIIGKIN